MERTGHVEGLRIINVHILVGKPKRKRHLLGQEGGLY
jgi:hypothetical protein